MHSRERPLGGWSAVLGHEEEEHVAEDARTDPGIAADEFLVDGPPTTLAPAPVFDDVAAPDPVLAALDELDGDGALSPEARAR
ncbi:hypothetical protein L6R52_41745, partial [Myxococcota bacterium]|nr:hypothetical protein [Myxococcota bacterium]